MSLPTPNLYPLRRLKVAATIRPSGVDKHTLDGELPVELCNYVDVYKNERISRRIEFMKASATAAEIERFSLCPGDVVITKDSETPDDIASAALVEESAASIICAYHLAIIRPDPNVITGNFLFWSLRCAKVLSQFSVRAQGVTRFGLTAGGMGNVLIPVAPAALQPIISAFLDRETAKIDALVAEQERLIGLLKEKRQAVISQAVTKGLDPNVPTKDSGVKWLGDVPRHWTVVALNRVASRIVVGIAEAAAHAYAGTGVPILRSMNIRPGAIIGKLLHLAPEYAAGRESKMIQAGDLVTVRTGHAGVTAVIPDELDGCQCFTMLVTSLLDENDPHFFCYALNSQACRHYFEVEAWGSAQPNISVPILKATPLPLPPRDEQKAIAAFLRAETNKLDLLISEAETATGLLAERRSALISAAVTGKIDVRGLAPAIQEAA